MTDENPNVKTPDGEPEILTKSPTDAFELTPDILPTEAPSSTEQGFWSSIKSVLMYQSYSVYLVTSWILGVFGVIMQSYLMLFLRDYLLFYISSIDFVYITIGIFLVIYMATELVARFFGGYVGDNYNRKNLSVLTMLVGGIGMLVLAFSTGVPLLLIGSLIMAGTALFASGSTSYIYEQIPPQHSGLAMGIFQTSSGFGLIGLGLVTWLLASGTPFVITIQIVFLVGAICYIIAAIVRAIFLRPPKPINRINRDKNAPREFIKQNSNALKLLYLILPIFMTVLILDAFSDGFYRFVSMFYLNEALAFTIGEISLMLIIVLAFSIPLSVTVGGFFDRRGSRRAILAVYSVMPITLVLLILAPIFPYWLPIQVVESLIIAYPILEPLLSTAFIAIAMKQINDILWWTLILTYLRKAIPRSETAKMLSIFFIIVMVAFVITPIPSGILYTYYGALPLLALTLGINFIILGILVFGNIEPKPIPDEYKYL
jgi:MFS family permease